MKTILVLLFLAVPLHACDDDPISDPNDDDPTYAQSDPGIEIPDLIGDDGPIFVDDSIKSSSW